VEGSCEHGSRAAGDCVSPHLPPFQYIVTFGLQLRRGYTLNCVQPSFTRRPTYKLFEEHLK
jgi:hypothetical protein